MVEPVRHRQTKGAETDMFEPKATASHLDSTLFGQAAVVAECPLLRDELTKVRRGLRSEFDISGHSGAWIVPQNRLRWPKDIWGIQCGGVTRDSRARGCPARAWS
jgi:hypothetical protein